MSLYTDFYIYPPRTKSRIPFTDNAVLRMWRKFPDSVAQFKLNGNRNLIKVKPDRTIEFWNRHKEIQKYVLPDRMRAEILDISPAGHYTVWDTELVHTKTKHVKNVIYFFDCLVWESTYLLGRTYAERFALVQARLGERYIPLDEYEIKDNLYIARNMKVEEWDTAWQNVQDATHSYRSHIEGFVLKRTGNTSRLEMGGTESNNGGFMCRIRKTAKNYCF